jgi:uncharacterized membrane protein YebE (DUF533 family)
MILALCDKHAKGIMKKVLLGVMILTALFTYACATGEGYNMQKGAAIGAVGGALAGQAIGRDTAGTLIGAAAGALVGAVAGNAVDQNEARSKAALQQPAAYPAPAQTQEAPPGQWIDVPGQWVGGKWVPAHRAWVPVNP